MAHYQRQRGERRAKAIPCFPLLHENQPALGGALSRFFTFLEAVCGGKIILLISMRGETPSCFSSYFFTPLLLSTLTGIVVSEHSMAGRIKGASTVSTPSGDREEDTFSTSADEGRLEGTNRTQLGFQLVAQPLRRHCP